MAIRPRISAAAPGTQIINHVIDMDDYEGDYSESSKQITAEIEEEFLAKTPRIGIAFGREYEIIDKADDKRGVFDPANDPFPGSEAEGLGCTRANARAVLARFAYTEKPPVPKDMRTQDLLNNLRMMNNPGDSVELTYRKRVRSPLTAMRAFCVECKGGSPKEATNCQVVECAFWAFRRGKNSMRGRK